jgi:tRNA nucleotidyltransferase (CCA-adding enzyme)
MPPASQQLEKIFRQVALRVSPSPSEAEAEKAFANRLISTLKPLLPMASISFIGSAARDTGLRNDRDIDLFVAFPPAMKEDAIVSLTFSATKKAIKAKWVKRYAQHPYLQAVISGFEVEVIPCFSIKPGTPIKSAVDRSPLHMAYLQSRLTPAQRRDVRVLKKLLKTAGLYGAEAKVAGFSGFVCELLILNFRNLASLLQAASKWRPPVVIDIEGFYSQDYAEVFSKFAERPPLIIIDVTDRNRNTAAAVSADNFARFVALSRAFLRAPSLSFFSSKPAATNRKAVLSAMKRRKSHFILLKMAAPKAVDDILYPQLRHTADNMAKFFAREGFALLDSTSFADSRHAYLVFDFSHAKTGPVKVQSGPLAYDDKSVTRFLSSRPKASVIRGPYLRAGRVFVEIQSDYSAVDAARRFKVSPQKNGAAGSFQAPLAKARIIAANEKIVSALSPQALEEFSAFVFKKEPWL